MQRDIATNPGLVGCVWLRTHYGPESNSLHQALLQKIDLFMALDDEDRLLNDEDLYDFGDDWRKILDVMPELVVSNAASLPDSAEELLEQAKNELIKAKAEIADQGKAVPAQVIDYTGPLEPIPLNYRNMLLVLRGKVHKACVVNYIIVEDKEALETGLLLLAFLDTHGRVVRWSRIDAEDAMQMSGFWMNSSWDELDEFLKGKLGDDYQVGGVRGHLLHI